MNEKFKNVPVDEDTKIKFNHIITLEPYEVLHQKWTWEGVTGESFIFDSRDVADLSNEELIAKAKTSPAVNQDSTLTVKRNPSGFDFVNFNFKS